jgi:hypothetical protein
MNMKISLFVCFVPYSKLSVFNRNYRLVPVQEVYIFTKEMKIMYSQ